MIQNIIALIIVTLVLVKVVYSVYKSVTIKDKSLCGGCASCELKNELKKKGKLHPYNQNHPRQKFQAAEKDLTYFAGHRP